MLYSYSDSQNEYAFGSRIIETQYTQDALAFREDLIQVGKYQHKDGRGPPNRVLGPLRLKKHGRMLINIGLGQDEVAPNVVLSDDSLKKGIIKRPWTENDASDTLHAGGLIKRHKIYQSFKDETVSLSKQKNHHHHLNTGDKQDTKNRLKVNDFTDEDVILCEHLERNPLAYGIEGTRCVFVVFSRVDKWSQNDDGFYNVILEEDEPSPLTFPIERGDHIKCLYVNRMGIYPLEEVPNMYTHSSEGGGEEEDDDDNDGEEVTDYLVSNGELRKCKRLYLLSQLEPDIEAPFPTDFQKYESMNFAPQNTNPGEMCMYRSSNYFYRENKELCGEYLLKSEMKYVLEAHAVFTRLWRWSSEASIALTGEKNVDYGMYRAVRFLVQELQMSPWYRTRCYRHVFKQAGSKNNPYPVGTVMRVRGTGDSSRRGWFVSYLPCRSKCDVSEDKTSDGKTPEDKTPLVTWFNDEDDERRIKRDTPGATTENQPGSILGSVNRQTSVDTWGVDEDEGDVLEQKKCCAKQKKPPLAKNKKNAPITGHKNDLRHLPVKKLDRLLRACGIPANYLCKPTRWEKTWMISKIASSKKGPKVLGGSLLKYRRADQCVQKTTTMKVKNEEAEVLTELEKLEYFKLFRNKTRKIWLGFKHLANSRVATVIPSVTMPLPMPVAAPASAAVVAVTTVTSNSSSSSSSKQEEDEELDDFAKQLALSLMDKKEDEVPIYRKLEESTDEYEARVAAYLDMKRNHTNWLNDRKRERSTEFIKSRIPKRTSFICLFEGTIEEDENGKKKKKTKKPSASAAGGATPEGKGKKVKIQDIVTKVTSKSTVVCYYLDKRRRLSYEVEELPEETIIEEEGEVFDL